jgi:hypothetical protein
MTCPECHGRGTVLDAPQNVLDGVSYLTQCEECNGTGKVHGELRLTIKPCDEPLCPLDATRIVTDNHNREWHVCDGHLPYFPPREGEED